MGSSHLISTKTASQLSGFSTRHIRRFIDAGVLPVADFGMHGNTKKKFFILRDKFEIWLEQKRTGNLPNGRCKKVG